MKIKEKRRLTWKDDWVEESDKPVSEMFYRTYERLPTEEELKIYIELVVMPRYNKYSKWYKRKKKNLYKLIMKNDKEEGKQRRGKISSD